MESNSLRLLTGPHRHSGAWNMAVDEAILEGVASGAPATLRIYGWEEPTVSLGYFQRVHPEIDPGGRFHGLATVRRLSGGGAILHHHEITYSCCLPAGHPLAEAPGQLYEEMHAAIAEALADFGVLARPRGESHRDDKTFLCFSRGDRRDLVCDGHKVVGSAQRRRRGAVLQHGSILLKASAHAPEFPGVWDLTGMTFNEAALKNVVRRNCAQILGGAATESGLSDSEQALAEALVGERYADPGRAGRG
jgi:lipoate-protein ligase A